MQQPKIIAPNIPSPIANAVSSLLSEEPSGRVDGLAGGAAAVEAAAAVAANDEELAAAEGVVDRTGGGVENALMEKASSAQP